MTYTIDYLPKVVSEDMPALPKKIAERVRKAIESRLTVDPISLGKPLRYSFKGHRRIRVGDYRILYRINPKKKTVTIVLI